MRKEKGKMKKIKGILKNNQLKSKKPNKEKIPRPKKYTARKAGAILFWVCFSFMFLVVLTTLFSSGSSENDNKENDQIIKINPSTKPEAIQFARDFIAEYFTWESEHEGLADREKRLSEYLANGLDEQGGLIAEGLESDAIFKGATIKKVDEKEGNTAHITFLVSFDMLKNMEDGKKNKQEAETISKYFVVPVAFHGESYGIYELPYFSYVDEKTTIAVNPNTFKTGMKMLSDTKTAENIRAFLDTFFDSYAEDTEDKLSYMLEDKVNKTGLNGSMKFVEIKDSEVFEGKKENEFSAIAEVVFEEPDFNTKFKSNYELTLKEKDGRYIVTKIRNKNTEKDLLEDDTTPNELEKQMDEDKQQAEEEKTENKPDQQEGKKADSEDSKSEKVSEEKDGKQEDAVPPKE